VHSYCNIIFEVRKYWRQQMITYEVCDREHRLYWELCVIYDVYIRQKFWLLRAHIMLPQVYKTDINLVNVYCLDIQHLASGIHACILYGVYLTLKYILHSVHTMSLQTSSYVLNIQHYIISMIYSLIVSARILLWWQIEVCMCGDN